MAATVGPKRSSQACKRCRQQKMKCTGGPEPCSRCTHMGRECIFEPASSMTAASRTGQGSSNTGAQQRPLVPFSEPPNFSDIQTPMSTDVDQQRPAKRSRLDLRQTTSHDSPHGFMVASPETPYTSVQSLEYQHHIPLSQPPPHSTSSLATPPETARRDGVRTQLVDILTESEISLAEAEQMFRLFGDRIAPFFPLFFNMNFSQLPMSPILGLAALHAIGRYLPDAAAMRLTLWRHLKICLKDLVFEMPERTSVIAVENMQGLAILYGCCEASSPGCSTAWDCLDAPDMLTAKSLAEGYAVKLGVGQLGNPFPNKFLAYVWWLWLYTMSHHAAILHNCVRTLSGIGGIREAKSYVEQTNTHNAVKRLLGEVELVLIWERVHFDGVPSAVKMGEELRMWADSWHDFLNAGDGRQLIFHQRFMTFQLYASLVHTESDLNLLGATRTVRAAQDFLHCTSRLPPVSKERIRYMCDFGFVMIAYACLFILQATRSTTLGDYKTELLRDVQEAANLLQSFSAKKNVRPAIYGYALQKLCEEYAKSAVAAHHVAADNNHGVPDSSSASFFASVSASTAAEMVAGQTATLGVGPQTTPESTSTFNTTLESPIVPGLGLCPSVEGFLAGDGMEAEVARSMSELWSLNQNFFTFEDEN